jgi:hypothetical protein
MFIQDVNNPSENVYLQTHFMYYIVGIHHILRQSAFWSNRYGAYSISKKCRQNY